MIPRSLRFRVLALIVAGVLQATMGMDAFGAHACPHHDGLPAAPATGDGVQDDAHASHGVSSDAPAAPAHDDHVPCSCMGDCSMAGGEALASRAAWQRTNAHGATRTPAVIASDAPRPSRPDFLIPFATAPPAPFAA